MLKLIDIVKEYKVDEESIFALHGVSVEFRKNEFVSILGPSGCGKTTLLNIVGGLDRYTSGDIQIEGVSTKEYVDVDWDTYRNHRVGFVFQSYNLIPHMSILKNVALSLTLAGVDRDERYKRALEALDKVGLASQAKKKPSQLSGGQMQRVAIARALVNNPDIILADEPTGALDSESGIQIMELLKEVADDRLVIMVTHNPQLAETYSTRIINLKDGIVVGDTMPYDSSDEEPAPIDEVAEEIKKLENLGDDQSEEDKKNAKAKLTKLKKLARLNIFKKRKEKRKKLEHSSMKIGTAINLSWNNLLSKKGRTLLTSIAGSIGIIGIILVLSLSNGATKYVESLEESALSMYPMTINETNMDMGAALNLLYSEDENKEEYPDSDVITAQEVLGKLISNIPTLLATNDLHSLKQYMDKNFDTSLASVVYEYGINFNAYITEPGKDNYIKIQPYSEAMMKVINELPGGLSEMMKEFEVGGTGFLDYIVDMFSSWSQISSNQDLLNSQYDLVGENSRWPTAADEIVICVDENNELIDYELFMLGIKSPDDVVNAITSGEFASNFETTVDELLSLRYKILTDADYLTYDEATGTYVQADHGENSKEFIDEHSSIEVKVVGVVRPKEGAVVTSISTVIGYTAEFMDYLVESAENNAAMKALLAAKEAAVNANESFYESNITYTSPYDSSVTINAGDSIEIANDSELLRSLGIVDMEYPTQINLYCASFDAKEKIEEFIDEYNETMHEDIQISDTLGTIMEYVDTMTTTITGVLVAFAAISLIVSTIMIAIIIYTSVLERRKEIGVLRSLGARKKDISRVFLAESGILGAYSGAIGSIISVIFSFAISAILKTIFKIEGLMSITWYYCIVMIALSIVLSMLAGFIPSRIAAKKDPAIALREE